MGWFDEQIRQRKLSDQEIFEDSIFRMASVVLGKQRAGVLNDERIAAKAAIDDILKYYHFKPVETPDSVRSLEDQLEYCLRPHGLMRRNVTLGESWYRDALGPMLAFRKEDGAAVAMLPKPFSGYCYVDPDTGVKTAVSKSTAAQFDAEAICFYRPLPLRKLGIPDLILYLKNCLNTGDYVFLVVLTLLPILLGLLMTNITRALTGFVLESRNLSLLLGTAVFMVSVIISSQIIGAVRELMMNRVELKTSLSTEAAMMMRLMNMPANFFRQYSSGELSSRYGAVNQLCELLLSSVFSTGLSSVLSLLYIAQIFHYAPALVAPALLIILASVLVSVISVLTQMKLSREIMEKGAKQSGL
ncbi:MAG: NHLP family bacteriocin export ABC transporter permease/ATPase subunit, partial [Oscillospiraceae bacterium]|nr:NHLP family bacteriocin export ABC transporter permease/ATPase subunit [Oscillospiraceae bacterium]